MLALILCILPIEDVVRDRCAVIELNHTYNDEGEIVWNQIIFRDWEPREVVIDRSYVDTTTTFAPVYVHYRDDWVQVMQPTPEVIITPRKESCGFQVVAWRLVKHPDQYPRRDWKNGGYVSVWHDGDVLRCVRADSFRETWTQEDPEVLNKAFLPPHERRGLRHERTK